MWTNDFRRAMKNFILSEGSTPEVDALLDSIDSALLRLSPKTKKDQRTIEMARHNINQVRKKYKRELSELKDLREQLDDRDE